MIKHFILFTFMVLISSCKQEKKTTVKIQNTQTSAWENLLDTQLSKWDIFLGIPHKSSGIKGYENTENVKVGTPLGIGNRKNVFTVTQENGEEILHITGEIFGSLNSKIEYDNYHLKFEVKWGQKRWEPRLEAKRNNGVLYHSIGDYGSGLWNTWMSSLEFEVEETNFGDFITINDKYVRAKCHAVKKEDGQFYYDPQSPLVNFCWTGQESGRCFAEDHEKPFGEWNSLELISYNGKSIHIVNGKVVMAVEQAEFFNGSKWIPMKKGKLQIQSEAAEAFYKNIKIKSISEVETDYKKYF